MLDNGHGGEESGFIIIFSVYFLNNLDSLVISSNLLLDFRGFSQDNFKTTSVFMGHR